VLALIIKKMKEKQEVYISYAWEKQEDGSNWPPILKNLYTALSNEGYKIKIDIHSINYKESIKSFMDELGRGKYIVTIISEKYLKSLNCMFEVLQLLKYPNFRSRIFPILLDGANVYDSKKILEYIKYWDFEINTLNQETKSLSNMVYAKPIFEDIEIMNEIRRIIATFGSTIGDMNVLNPQVHDNTNFEALIKLINAKFLEDNQSKAVELQNNELQNQILQLNEEIELLKLENTKLLVEITSKNNLIDELNKISILSDTKIVQTNKKSNIIIFENIAGFSRNTTQKDIIENLGMPTKDEISTKHDFNSMSYNDYITFSYYKKSKKLMAVNINMFGEDCPEVVNYLSNLGIKDKKLSYLGLHKNKVIEDFGTPTDISSGNYHYDTEDLCVDFICYDFNEYLCSSISIQFFFNNN
jgi:hypothetical protein